MCKIVHCTTAVSLVQFYFVFVRKYINILKALAVKHNIVLSLKSVKHNLEMENCFTFK